MGKAWLSRRARLAAMRSGSPPVPDMYGPAMSTSSGRLADSVSWIIVAFHAKSCSFVHHKMPAPGTQGVAPSFMLTAQRKQLIIKRLASHGQIVAKDLARELDTSEDTIRRDLRELALQGRLQRVHGGALPASAAVGDLQMREQVSSRDKQALGRHGATLIQPGQVVLLDGGTTAIQVARHLPAD